jgi:hypothetical protein
MIDEIPEQRQQHSRDDDDYDLLQRNGDAGDIVYGADQRRDRLVARPLGHLDKIRQRDRHTDRGNKWRQAEGSAQRTISNALDRPVPQTRHQHRNEEHNQEQNCNRKAREHGSEDEKDNKAGKTAKHEDIAMGEIDHADNAVNHRIANSHKAIDGSKSQPINELLDKIFHMSFPLDASQISQHLLFLEPLMSP